MKKILLSAILLLPFVFSNAQDTSSFELLKKYFQIKEALVEGDAKLASKSAGDLSKILAKADNNKLDKEILKKLSAETLEISASNELEKQRDAFSPLSEDIYQLAKKTKLSESAVYRQYCPMKKMYWLSAENVIRNPYYGSMMLSCGKVVETIKP